MSEKILQDIAAERQRQESKWGTQRHDLPVWMAVLGEELGETTEQYGELCKAVLDVREAISRSNGASTAGDISATAYRLLLLRSESIQMAAVIVAMIEHMDEAINTLEASTKNGMSGINALEGIDAIMAKHKITGW